MRILYFFILLNFTECLALDENIFGFFEAKVLNVIRTENIREISIATKVFQENDYYKILNITNFDEKQSAKLFSMLNSIEWADSLSVATRNLPEFIILLKMKTGDVYGLHSSNGIEDDCFYIVGITLGGDPHVKTIVRQENINLSTGKTKGFQRVLKVPGWRNSKVGIQIEEMLENK